MALPLSRTSKTSINADVMEVGVDSVAIQTTASLFASQTFVISQLEKQLYNLSLFPGPFILRGQLFVQIQQSPIVTAPELFFAIQGPYRDQRDTQSVIQVKSNQDIICQYYLPQIRM